MILAHTFTGSSLTVNYIRDLLTRKATSHIDTLQNACLCNTIRNDGRLIVRMGNTRFDVVPSPSNPQQLNLYPVAIIDDCTENSVAGLGSSPLRWGAVAFEAAILAGEIDLKS